MLYPRESMRTPNLWRSVCDVATRHETWKNVTCKNVTYALNARGGGTTMWIIGCMWFHHSTFDSLPSFYVFFKSWRNFDVMTYNLRSWRTFWCHYVTVAHYILWCDDVLFVWRDDVVLTLWHTFLCDHVLLTSWSNSWLHDVPLTSWSTFWHCDLFSLWHTFWWLDVLFIIFDIFTYLFMLWYIFDLFLMLWRNFDVKTYLLMLWRTLHVMTYFWHTFDVKKYLWRHDDVVWCHDDVFWCHEKLFDVMRCFLTGVMPYFLMSWHTFWCHDMTHIWRQDVFFYFMMYFWCQDILSDVMMHFDIMT